LSIRQTAALLCQTTASEILKPRGQSAALNLTNATRYFHPISRQVVVFTLIFFVCGHLKRVCSERL
jgi:hypothetical protein